MASYYPMGQIRTIGAFVDGCRWGFWTRFNENGSKAAEGFFVRGRGAGVWTYYSKEHPEGTQGPFDSIRALGFND